MKNRFSAYKNISSPYPNSFFMGANSALGFISQNDILFCEEELKKIYILKGGPGTGKSSMMRAIADAACSHGFAVEYYFCGSDPDSLDAVILRSGEKSVKVAVMDGTAPHLLDPVYPGACGEIINLGEFWDRAVLESVKPEIASLSQMKAECFGRAYKYLKATDEIDGELFSCAKKALLTQKLTDAVQRIVKPLKKSSSHRVFVRYTEAVSMNGAVSLPTFELICEKHYIVLDEGGLYREFFRILTNNLAAAGHEMIICPSALNPENIRAVYLPELKLYFSTGEKTADNQAKYINMRRFVDLNVLSSRRSWMKFLAKCRESLYEGAIDALSEAKSYHFALEDIYIQAMNFDGIEKRTKKLQREILQCLK